MLNRLLDWEERPDIQRQKYEKVVVIKGLFTDEDIRVKNRKYNKNKIKI